MPNKIITINIIIQGKIKLIYQHNKLAYWVSKYSTVFIGITTVIRYQKIIIKE